MKTISTPSTFDQLWATVQRLPRALKLELYQRLDAEFSERDIEKEFREALYEVREAYKHIPESEIEADIDLALEQIRAEKSTRRS